MKHLDVLHEAGLLIWEKRGRERYNFLNAVPLQVIRNRWMTPASDSASVGLLKLKHSIEKQEDIHLPQGEKVMSTFNQVNTVSIRQEIQINANAQKVYQALTGDIGSWWGAPYLLGDNPVDIVLDLKLGGHLCEVWANDSGFGSWGTVTALSKGKLLEITGSCGMSGAVSGIMRFELEEKGNQTTLKLSHDAMGTFGKETQEMYSGGWKDLLETRLKAFVEQGKRLGVKAL
jgi:uncharacterized protein YndB with AHSA1/START domain